MMMYFRKLKEPSFELFLILFYASQSLVLNLTLKSIFFKFQLYISAFEIERYIIHIFIHGAIGHSPLSEPDSEWKFLR